MKFTNHPDGEGVAQLQNFRLHSVASTGSLSGTNYGGRFCWVSASGDKRIYFYDDVTTTFISVPRLDRDESVTGTYSFTSAPSFSPGSAGVPFTLNSNAQGQKVAGLHADQIDGAHADAAASNSTIPIRDSNGRMKATDPSSSDDVVNLGYLAGYVAGIRDPKDACRVATTGNLSATRSSNTLTASSNASINTAGIDGITSLAVNDRVLVKNQSTGADNGIYIISDLGSAGTPWVMQRATDADSSTEVTNGMQVWITAGTTNAQSGWLLSTADPITLNTTALTFIQVNGTAEIDQGNGIVISGNTVHAIQSSSYTAGGFVYATSTSALGFSSALSGIVIGQNTSAPTVISGLTAGKLPKYQASSPYLVNSLLSESGTTVTSTSEIFKVFNGTSGSASAVEVHDASGNGGACTKFLGSSTNKNWLIGNQVNVNGGLEITPSTTNGGSTFTTPAVYLLDSGRIGVGTSPAVQLHVESTSDQLRIGYNSTRYAAWVVDSSGNSALSTTNNGNFTITPNGTGKVRVGYLTTGLVSADSSGSLINYTLTSNDVPKYETTIGNGSATSITVTHNLGLQFPQISVYRTASPYDKVYPDIEATSTTTCTIKFLVAPTTNEYTVHVSP